jgi:hypothetical protein
MPAENLTSLDTNSSQSHSSMRSRPRALLMSKYCPPMYAVGGKRAHRFARYLDQYGWDSILWTMPTPQQIPLDPTPVTLPQSVTLVRTLLPDTHQDSAPPVLSGTPQNQKWSQKIKRLLVKVSDRFFAWPVDGHLKYYSYIINQGRALLTQTPCDLIWATSSPYSMLFFAVILKRKHKLPLCLDLRDPWSLNFLEKRRPAWIRWINRLLERWILQHADHIIFTCEACTLAYQELYPQIPSHRWSTITNAFDPNDFLTLTASDCGDHKKFDHKKMTPSTIVEMVHFGRCYGPRRLKTILWAMHLLIKKKRICREELKLTNYGQVQVEDLQLAEQLDILDLFEHRAEISYGEGIQKLSQCDLQILLAYENETLYIPAKFFDYLLSKAPILCLSQVSDLTRYIELCQVGGWTTPDHVQHTADLIEARYLQKKNSSLHDRTHQSSVAQSQDHQSVDTHPYYSFDPNQEHIQKFTTQYTTQRLAEVFQTIKT